MLSLPPGLGAYVQANMRAREQSATASAFGCPVRQLPDPNRAWIGSATRACIDCDTSWTGAVDCWSCGQPGQPWMQLNPAERHAFRMDSSCRTIVDETTDALA